MALKSKVNIQFSSADISPKSRKEKELIRLVEEEKQPFLEKIGSHLSKVNGTSVRTFLREKIW